MSPRFPALCLEYPKRYLLEAQRLKRRKDRFTASEYLLFAVVTAAILCLCVCVGSVSVPLKDGKLTMELFIDRSLVEGFFNRDKSISVRSYAEPSCQQIQLFADNELQIELLQVYTVSSIYE